VFSDQGKLTLLPNSILDISQYQFQDPGKNDVASYSLVKGGLRVLTGIIGEKTQEAYKVSTLVATMGIRGPGFDLLCQGDCVSEGNNRDDKKSKQITQGKADGLYTFVWLGTITQTNAAGTFELKEGESSYIANDKSQPQLMPNPHPVLQDNPAPRPDSVATLFEMATQNVIPPGIYVTVHDGSVSLITDEGHQINIGPQNTGFIAPEGIKPVLLDGPVAFQSHDPFPSPDNFDPELAEVGVFSLLADSFEENFVTNGFVCGLQ